MINAAFILTALITRIIQEVPPDVSKDPNLAAIKDTNTLIYILCVLFIPMILSNAGMWIREYAKAREFKKKNGVLERIEKNSEMARLDAAKAAQQASNAFTKIDDMTRTCAETRLQFSNAIQKNTDRIITQASKGK